MIDIKSFPTQDEVNAMLIELDPLMQNDTATPEQATRHAELTRLFFKLGEYEHMLTIMDRIENEVKALIALTGVK